MKTKRKSINVESEKLPPHVYAMLEIHELSNRVCNNLSKHADDKNTDVTIAYALAKAIEAIAAQY